MERLCLTFLVLTSALSTSSGLQFYRTDYQYYKTVKYFYKVHERPSTWQDAFFICSYEGARLYSPQEIQLEDFKKIAKSGNASLSSCHIRHTLQNNPDVIKLTSYKGIVDSSSKVEWASGEPDNLNNAENCLAVSGEGKFSDINCNTPQPFVCIVSKEEVKRLTVATQCGIRDTSYVYDENTKKCYKQHQKELNHKYAAMACAAEGGNLVTLENELKLNAVKNINKSIANEFLVGYTSEGYGSIMIDANGDEAHFVKMTFSTSAELARAERVCWRKSGSISSFTLTATNCNERRKFVCEKDAGRLGLEIQEDDDK